MIQHLEACCVPANVHLHGVSKPNGVYQVQRGRRQESAEERRPVRLHDGVVEHWVHHGALLWLDSGGRPTGLQELRHRPPARWVPWRETELRDSVKREVETGQGWKTGQREIEKWCDRNRWRSDAGIQGKEERDEKQMKDAGGQRTRRNGWRRTKSGDRTEGMGQGKEINCRRGTTRWRVKGIRIEEKQESSCGT